MTATLGAKEIKILAISILLGFLLLFPRLLLINQVMPDFMKTIQETVGQYAPEAAAQFEKARTPAKSYQNKPKKSAPSGTLRVEGIIYESKGQSSVIINDQILVVGDTIGAYQVIEIQSQHVVLKKGKDVYILSQDSTLERASS